MASKRLPEWMDEAVVVANAMPDAFMEDARVSVDGDGIISFPVVAEVATITLNGGVDGDTPGVAAYKAVEAYDKPGTYSFPNVHGGTTTVTISDGKG